MPIGDVVGREDEDASLRIVDRHTRVSQDVGAEDDVVTVAVDVMQDRVERAWEGRAGD